MRISVYITSYNQEVYLREAVDSVLAQTLRPHQIVIVDDCSQDASPELIDAYARRYADLITPVYHQENAGVAQARVSALQAVTGDYVTYLDGDDRYLPTKLEKEAAMLKSRPGVDIVFANVYHINSVGKRMGVWSDKQKPPEGDVFTAVFARDFPRGSLFRNELINFRAWQQVGFHDPKLKTHEDYDMRIRLTKHLRTAYVDEPLSEYRKHESGLRNTAVLHKLATLETIWRKNKHLLADLPAADRRYINRRLDEWRAHFWRVAAKQAVGAWSEDASVDRWRAWQAYNRSWQYHRALDFDLLLGLFLPHSIYHRVRTMMRNHKQQAHKFE
jgi:glycosyltransferase involved in cell wall biosynthesis